MTKQKINQEQMLMDMMNITCENIGFEEEDIRKELNNLYSRLIDIMEKSCSSEQKEILHAIDDAVSSMLCNYYDDGVVAGMELIASVNNLMLNPSKTYRKILSNIALTGSPYKTISLIADKYDMITDDFDV